MMLRPLFLAMLLPLAAVTPAASQTCQPETAVPATTVRETVHSRSRDARTAAGIRSRAASAASDPSRIRRENPTLFSTEHRNLENPARRIAGGLAPPASAPFTT